MDSYNYDEFSAFEKPSNPQYNVDRYMDEY